MELVDLPAHILVQNIRLRRLKAVDLLEATLERIRRCGRRAAFLTTFNFKT